MSTHANRRRHQRQDVIGVLRATLDITTAARVVNMGRGGALIESDIPALANSTRMVTFTLGSEEIQVLSRVCHVTPTPARANAYTMGLEFNEPLGLPAPGLD